MFAMHSGPPKNVKRGGGAGAVPSSDISEVSVGRRYCWDCVSSDSSSSESNGSCVVWWEHALFFRVISLWLLKNDSKCCKVVCVRTQ